MRKQAKASGAAPAPAPAGRASGATSAHSLPAPKRYVVFRGNGYTYLRAAFARRPEWQAAGLGGVTRPQRSHRSNSEARVEQRQAMERTRAEQLGVTPTKLEENLHLSKCLREGGVAFVFRDLLVGPLHVEGLPLAEGQTPPNASIFSDHYPPTAADGHPQVVNRWPRHTSLTSKDGGLKALCEYYRCQGLNPWQFFPLSFALPNFALSRAEPSHAPAWLAVVQAHDRVAAGRESRIVDSEQARANLWLLKPTNGSGGEGIVLCSDLDELANALTTAKASTQGFLAQK